VVEQKPALLFSFEMRSLQIVSNFLCLHARLNSQHLRQGKLDEQGMSDLENAIRDLQGIPLFIDDSSILTVMDLRARARRMMNQEKIELVVVDYLQLVKPRRDRDNRATEVAEVSHGLKSLARELNVPVVAVAQLRRDAEDREPRMSDLRESGAIEQDADVIMLLHRPKRYEDTETAFNPNTEAELYIAKQRNGPIGKINLVFMGHCFKFEPRAH